eukprot:Anaeramoba_flamelloidesa953_77.p1 GENE.a953_77~~a953_77.p1  ORF type:complete len:672 (-),score=168.70 a953_77:7-1956(-)
MSTYWNITTLLAEEENQTLKFVEQSKRLDFLKAYFRSPSRNISLDNDQEGNQDLLKKDETSQQESSSEESSSEEEETDEEEEEKENNKNINVAESLMEEMRNHSPNLVNEAELVSNELIRIGILWEELWHKGLENASKAYFGNNDEIQMITELQPLYELIENGASTMREYSFLQNYGRDLFEAKEWCNKYLKKPDIGHLTQAWNLYSSVFQKIIANLPKMTKLNLSYISPQLSNIENLELAMPGTYKANKDIIKIKEFSKNVNVILSKQRPRKIKIKSSNGKMYKFLLKGHEDPRLDERVMQLFSLVNTLLKQSPKTSQSMLKIRRYSVIPLSTNSGLIEWVPHCNTLHELIREYRDARNIVLDLERKLMREMAQDYNELIPIQKVEVFLNALDNSPCEAIAKVLWLKSANSESWLTRRTNYTRSLALMSMVGYILGLGDRHPSNLMMERFTGKILHIDFGDCFEVTRQRDLFPEKIPFRLTRMLVSAMEVSGIEGNYRNTCENVMKLLRVNKESLMAMLETFIHDPLIGWKLIDDNKEINEEKFTKVRDVDYHRNQPQINQLETLQSLSLRNSSTIRSKTLHSYMGINGEDENERARSIVKRIKDKLTGRDFDSKKSLDVKEQVEMLIDEATSIENLCQCYIGWCPFW